MEKIFARKIFWMDEFTLDDKLYKYSVRYFTVVVYPPEGGRKVISLDEITGDTWEQLENNVRDTGDTGLTEERIIEYVKHHFHNKK